MEFYPWNFIGVRFWEYIAWGCKNMYNINKKFLLSRDKNSEKCEGGVWKCEAFDWRGGRGECNLVWGI